MSGPNDPSAPRSGARILDFRRRPGAAKPPRPQGEPDAVEDLSKYEEDNVPDDYKHRMAVNVAAFVVLAALAGIGYWLADSMASMRKNQDCVLSGRRNCAGINIPTGDRF